MRPINYLFKSGLTKCGIPTNFCPKIISQWVEKQNKYAKFSMAIVLFFILAIITNITKTEASLITKFGIAESYDEFNAKIRKGETWLFFISTTASQMFTFSLATNYRLFNFEILLKKIRYFFQPDINLVEENLIKLENDSNNLLFGEEETEINERTIINLEAFNTNIPDAEAVQSTSQVTMPSNEFNPELINGYSLNNESKVNLHTTINYLF